MTHLHTVSRLLASNVKELLNQSCWKLRSGKNDEDDQLKQPPYPLLLRQGRKMCSMMMGKKSERLADFSLCQSRAVLLALCIYYFAVLTEIIIFLLVQAWFTTISLAICKVGSQEYLIFLVFKPFLFQIYYLYFFIPLCILVSFCHQTICQAMDLLEMLKKEEEMLSAIKEKQSKVNTFTLMLIILIALIHYLEFHFR